MTGFFVANSIAGAMANHPKKAGAVSALVGAFHYGSGIFGSMLVGLFADGTPWPMGWVIALSGVASSLSFAVIVGAAAVASHNLAATAASIPNRVFIYHVNADSSATLRFSVLIKNTGSSNATLSVRQSGYSGPSTSYGVVGETAFYNWLITTNPAATQTVAPGQVVRLDTNFDTINVRHNDLMNGIWDYTFNQPHAIMVCALTANEDPVVVGPTLPVLARDSHVRGTFTACNKNYDTAASVLLNTTAGIQQFPIAGSSDAFVTGYDNAVSPPTAQTNSGNYGVFYNIQLNTSASDGRALGILINPQGGAWSGAANAGPGILPGGNFIIPTNGLTISAATNAAVAGEYFPNGGATVQLQFMPTGASSFPVYVMTVPYASSAPDLAAISNYTINAGQTVNFTTSVGDPNGTPPLNFSLPQAPAGASIGSVSGVFSWRAPIASAGTMQSVQVAVSDSGSPPFNDAQTFSISVNPLSPVTANAKSLGANSIQLQVSGPVGPDYILQGNTNLSNPGGWLSILTNTPSTTPFYLTETNADNFSDRYYRILLGPL